MQNGVLSVAIISILSEVFVYFLYLLYVVILAFDSLKLYFFLIPEYLSVTIATWMAIAALISYICLLVGKKKKLYYLYLPYIVITVSIFYEFRNWCLKFDCKFLWFDINCVKMILHEEVKTECFNFENFTFNKMLKILKNNIK